MPWLVLKLTGDAFAMGAVLAIAAVPRAIFMLLGGVVVDRFSPRVVMILSNAARMALVLILALTTWQESISMGLVYAVALLFGLADAFMFPAASAFPPRLLPPAQLAAGNSLFQGTAQITLIVGPLLAGGLIVLFGGESVALAGADGERAIQDVVGLALVFGIDAVSFVVPLLILLLIRDRFPPENVVVTKVWSTLVEGLRYTWEDLPLRT
ncbi:MAG: MFS transporter, partial [Gammaproteobacteria bacterium]